MQYKNRLAELRGDQSQAEFAARLGMTQQNYWKYENGKQGLRSDLIVKICEEFGCTAEWLLALDNLPLGMKGVEDGFVNVPIYGEIAAGKITDMVEYEDEFPVPIQIKSKHPNSALLRVKGRSVDLIIPENYLALIDFDLTEPNDHDLFAVCVNGYAATLKGVERLANGYRLIPKSSDPTFQPIVFDYNKDDTEQVTIMGTAVWAAMPFDYRLRI